MSSVNVSGTGIATMNIVPQGDGLFEAASFTVTFAAPERSTATVLFIGFGLSGFQAWTGMWREQRWPGVR
jgi:hypothetical protein